MSTSLEIPGAASTPRTSALEPAGRLEAIWLKRFHGGPMDPVSHARLLTGQGLESNADLKRKRQVTVISAEAWADVEAELGRTLDPGTRRANLLVRGLELKETRDRVLRVGGCRLQVNGETRPCRQMEESVAGLQAALSPEWRGGVFAEVLEGGEIAVGDAVSWE